MFLFIYNFITIYFLILVLLFKSTCLSAFPYVRLLRFGDNMIFQLLFKILCIDISDILVKISLILIIYSIIFRSCKSSLVVLFHFCVSVCILKGVFLRTCIENTGPYTL